MGILMRKESKRAAEDISIRLWLFMTGPAKLKTAKEIAEEIQELVHLHIVNAYRMGQEDGRKANRITDGVDDAFRKMFGDDDDDV